mmetsp:Transcript_31965/g.54073  ORF Transcript_31965/g.54073 Transcript_31965/m.54073 type:complete len:323 (-) Transcript_31965:175-1143(-)
MKKSVALTPIALMLCPSLVMSLQIITPPLKEQKSHVPSFSSIKQPCYHTTMRHRRKNSSSFATTAPVTTAASSYTTLFSTPTNAIDAEIIKYKRTLLFPSNTKRRRNSGSPLHSSTSSNGNASSPSEEDTTTTTSPSESTISFLKAVDNFGMSLKPLAIQAYEKSNAINGESKQQTNNKQISLKSLFHRVKSNILWMMYIIYRGYRGFFVILPAVFREVYRQLEESDLVMDAYGDEEEVENGGGSSSGEVGEKKPLRLRTRITTSILSSILTMSYVVSGGIRVLGKFIQTFTNTTSVESSLEAAADEMADNEDKLAGRYKGK